MRGQVVSEAAHIHVSALTTTALVPQGFRLSSPSKSGLLRCATRLVPHRTAYATNPLPVSILHRKHHDESKGQFKVGRGSCAEL